MYNELGYGLQERIYQKAVAHALARAEIRFIEQVPLGIHYHGQAVGKYLLDFLIEDRIVLELKQGGIFPHKHFQQVINYLRVTGKPLAILANFTSSGIVFRRVLKPNS